MMTKDELRKYALNKRKGLTINKEYLEKQVLKKIGKLKNVAIYYPLKYEIDLTFLNNYDVNLYYPKVNDKDMIFFKNPTRFEKGLFNVYEPVDGKIDLNIDIMFVPSLVINNDNYRIGYGKGYYDRYLKNKNIRTIGICYEELFVNFKEDVFDQRLDEVIICKQ